MPRKLVSRRLIEREFLRPIISNIFNSTNSALEAIVVATIMCLDITGATSAAIQIKKAEKFGLSTLVKRLSNSHQFGSSFPNS